jgi:membrane protease YdiL (CAAX protease family)
MHSDFSMNKSVFLLGLITLLGFGIGGILIITYFQDLSFLEIWRRGDSTFLQLGKGGLAGLSASGIALFIISRKFFEKEGAFYYGLIGKLSLNRSGIIFLSLCAGIGEEIFFRAAIQPFLGISLTSFLFVLLHGYLTPKNLRLSIYGLVLTVIIIGFGYLFELSGLLAAITAHAVFDLVLLFKMTGIRPLPAFRLG